MTNSPTLTPLEATDRALTQDGFTHEGFTYTLDGPMGTPTKFLAPTAEKAGQIWFCSGEDGEAITAITSWIILVD